MTGSDPDDAVDRVGALLAARPARLGDVRLVTVDGPSGSGKSTFAAMLAERLRRHWDTAVVSTDLLATWDDPFGWWSRLESGLLRPLAAGRPALLDRLEWSTGRPLPAPPLVLDPPEVLVLEGVSAGRREVADRTGVAVWVEVPGRVARLERAVARDGEASRPLLSAWQDAEDRFFAADRPALRADLLIDPSPEDFAAQDS